MDVRWAPSRAQGLPRGSDAFWGAKGDVLEKKWGVHHRKMGIEMDFTSNKW